MIIKIIPETDAERLKQAEIEHRGVKDFFMFGNKRDADAELVDFHDWRTESYRYLLGGLHYFHEIINDERKAPKNIPQLNIVDVNSKKNNPMIKRGTVEDQKIQKIDLTNLVADMAVQREVPLSVEDEFERDETAKVNREVSDDAFDEDIPVSPDTMVLEAEEIKGTAQKRTGPRQGLRIIR